MFSEAFRTQPQTSQVMPDCPIDVSVGGMSAGRRSTPSHDCVTLQDFPKPPLWAGAALQRSLVLLSVAVDAPNAVKASIV